MGLCDEHLVLDIQSASEVDVGNHHLWLMIVGNIVVVENET